MKTIIPAAGYATRLYPLTKNKPKALIEIGGKPMLNRVLDRVKELPVNEVIIISNSKFYHNFKAWAEQQEYDFKIKILDDGTDSEENRLGAIGDKYFAIKTEKIKGELLDISADNLFEFSLKKMYEYFKQKNSTIVGVYDVKKMETAKKLGIIEMNEKNIVTGFWEKPENPKSTLASTAVYMYPEKDVKLFKTYLNQNNKPDNPGYFIEWLHKKTDVYGYSCEGKWFDIGSFEQLKEAGEYLGEKK